MNDIYNDVFHHVVSFLDCKSAVRLTMLTSKNLSCRQSQNQGHVWRQIFERHLFAPVNDEIQSRQDNNSDSYLHECYRRRQLFDNLLGKNVRKKSTKHMKQQKKRIVPYGLSNCHFRFLPIFPPDDEEGDWQYDAPPVDYDCPSFILTSPGDSGAFLFLDPFDGSFTIREISKAIYTSNPGEQQMVNSIMKNLSNWTEGKKLDDNYITCPTASPEEYIRDEPTHVLLNVSDYFDINLHDYYILQGNQHHYHHQQQLEADVLRPDDELEVDFLGIDSKLVMDWNCRRIVETMATVGRIFCKDNENDNSVPCVEFMAWNICARNDSQSHQQRRVCRVRSSFETVDMDPYLNRLYMSFPYGEGPFRHFDTDAMTNPEGSAGRVIAVYPLEPYESRAEEDSGPPRYFPEPLFVIKCEHALSTFSVAPGGTHVLVATMNGKVQVWRTCERSIAKKMDSINVIRVLKSLQQQTPSSNEQSHGDEDQDAAINPIVSSFHFTNHRKLEETGFVTHHHEHGKGCWLLLWKKKRTTFEVVSRITLPLSSRRSPRIHYDGRRLLVLGQDQIGMILLVYHVLSTWEDVDDFEDTTDFQQDKEKSGGVFNFKGNCVQYANRIRHAALGGFEYYDSVFMTANERYVMINTKTGNLLGSPRGTDGIFVIDLQDETLWETGENKSGEKLTV